MATPTVSHVLAVFGILIVVALVYYVGVKSAGVAPKPLPALPQATASASGFGKSPITPTPLPSASASSAPVLAGAPVPADDRLSAPSCGDFRCDLTERCDACPQDCGCAGNEYCSADTGTCQENLPGLPA